MKRGLYDLQYATGGEIRAIYQDLFGRQPDPEGLAYWSEQLKGAPISEAYRQIGGGATGRDVREVSAAEIASKSQRYIPDEYFTEPQAVYGDEPIDSVTEAYQRLFNRTPSVEEVNYYQNLFGDTINPFELERMIAGAQNEDVSAVATPSPISGDLFVGAPIERPATPTPVTATATPATTTAQTAAPAMDLTYGGAAPFSAPTSYRTLMGTNVETPTSTGLVSLYRNVLGRLPDAEGYNAYMEAFGPTIDPLEAEQFRAGAMNELAQKAERQSYDRQQFAERVASPLIGGSAKYTSPVTNAAAARTFTPTADFGYNTQVQPFPITPGLIASPLARGAGAANTGATNTGAANTSTIATVGADGFSGSSAYLPGQNIAGVTFTDTPDAASPEPMPLPYSSTIPFGNEGQTPVLQPILTTTREGQPTADDVDNSRTSGILKTIIGEQAPAPIEDAMGGGDDWGPGDFPMPGDDEGSEDPVDVIGRYAGGPVTGSPQYFAEGGAAKPGPMTKYSSEELGATFDISEYIDPETGRFMINEYQRDVVFNPELERAETAARASMTPEQKKRDLQALMIRRGQTGREYGLPLIASGFATSGIRPMNQYTYAKGGLADAARYGYAEELRQQGRNGDTILAHINPTEAKMLEAMGGSGTINPRTGLPEYGFSWKKLFRVASKIVPFIIPNPITAAVAAGTLAGASTPGKTFDFKRGLQTGIMTYAGGKLGEKVGTEFGTTANATSVDQNILGSVSGEAAGQTVAQAAPTIGQQISSALPNVSQYIPEGININPTTLGQSYGAITSDAAAEEGIKLREAQQAIIDEEERRRKGYLQVAQETGGIQPLTFGAARGGLIALAGGGAIDPVAFEGGGMTAPINQPRMLSGGGDGMSDSIPATIDGTQPARLADGEFVIPADVVADIGNGSSSAGAKRLYGMMDRVRTARHGTTKQPPEIKTNRLMPA